MREEDFERVRRRRGWGSGFSVFLRSVGELFRYVLGRLLDDMRLAMYHARLFIGSALIIYGLLSVKAGRNCDGVIVDFGEALAECTRPSTFYYYPALSIISVILGIWLVVIWVMFSRNARRESRAR